MYAIIVTQITHKEEFDYRLPTFMIVFGIFNTICEIDLVILIINLTRKIF